MTAPCRLALEEVSEKLAYDPESGTFTWRVRTKGSRGIGSVAGGIHPKLGYRTIGISGQRHYAHRLAWLLTHGEWPLDQIDHVNGDRSDNRISNLRPCTHAENQLNRHVTKPNKHGYRGVDIDPNNGTFRIRVVVDGKRHQRHGFATAEAAHRAYIELRAEVNPMA